MGLMPGQEKCIKTLDRSIVVTAGAGSGKTFTLTRRIVGALESGFLDDIGQVCAITFTNKAAAELKSRVKAELRAVGLVEQSLKADDAWISTIHGMCARILRAHAVELGLDPAFEMADAALVERFLDQAVEEVIAEVEMAGDAAQPDGVTAAVGASALAALFDEYPARSSSFGGNSVESMLRDLISVAASDPRGVAAFRLPDFPVNPTRIVASALDCMDGLLQDAEQEKSGKSRDEWVAKTGDALAAAHAAFDDAGVADALHGLRLLSGFGFSKKFGSKPFKERVDECAEMLNTCVMELRLNAAAPYLRTLVSLAQDALARFDAKKRRAGVLDNNDLLVLASRALGEREDIARDYGNRFRLVMVDEFQDTDQVQVDMIKRIAGPGACRLCTVGDAQQSIYRFRGADVSVYRRHVQAVRAGDADSVILLPHNFRSHADVLSLVDRVFEQPDMFGGEFMSLMHGRDEDKVAKPFPAGLPRVRIQQVSKAHTKGVPSEQVVQEQARRIAAAFAEMRDAGCSAGDMAVLLGRMKNADVFAGALREQGFDCVVSGGSVFAQSPEAGLVLDLARVAANPADTEALWRVLASPLFRVSDDDLLLLVTAYGDDGSLRRRKLDAGLRAMARLLAQDAQDGCDAQGRRDGREAHAMSPQLRNALRVLGDLGRTATRSRMSAALMRAAVDSGWVSRLQAQGPEGLAAAGNVYKAIRLVEDVEEDGAVGPVGTMRAFEQLLACAKEAPGALSTGGGDFVRIMTVHASKGLEFPIVAIAEFGNVRASASKLLVLPGDDAILLSLDLGRSLSKIGGAADAKGVGELYAQMMGEDCDEESLKARAFTAGGALELRSAISEHGRLGDEEEAKRLLYVALTRAKESLVISMAGSRTKANPNAVPGNCMASVVSALEKTGAGFEPGRSSFGFGGTADAVVEHFSLVLEEGEGEAEDGQPRQGEAAPASEREPFMVPAPQKRAPVSRVPYLEAREGLFSYSSIAPFSHEDDLLGSLAQRFAVSCDDPALGVQAEDAPDDAGFVVRRRWEDLLSTLGAEDDGSWAYLPAKDVDEDKATDLGTAFHRLAQFSADARGASGVLEPPSSERVRAMARTCGLDARSQLRLGEALGRWFASAEAAEMARWPQLRAEVPFVVPIGRERDGKPAFLEGEIDLLAMDADGQRARVVDYKTGGHPGEPCDALARKHVLQASCYAYSLLMQGVQQIEASFVRVECGQAQDPSQPQCVRYRFSADDVPVLAQAIAQVHALAAKEG